MDRKYGTTENIGNVRVAMDIMVNAKAKGDRIERKCKETLEDMGYWVEKPVRTKWSRKDFFGLFDLIAIGKDTIKFIQVKTNTMKGWNNFAKGCRELLIVEEENIDCEMWCWHDNQGWRVKRVTENGWEKIMDERKT